MKDKALLRNKYYDECSKCKVPTIFDKNIVDRGCKAIPLTLARKKHRCGYRGVAISKENILKQTPQPIAKAKQIRSRISAPCNYQDHKKRPVGKIDPVELDLMVFDDDYMMTCSDRICSQCGNDHSFKNNFKDVKTSIDALSELLFPKYLTSSTKSDYPKHEEETF